VYAVKEALRPIAKRKYTVKVEVGAKNTPPTEAYFEIWVDEKEGVKCIQL
jgi:hypothetical protein